MSIRFISKKEREALKQKQEQLQKAPKQTKKMEVEQTSNGRNNHSQEISQQKQRKRENARIKPQNSSADQSEQLDRSREKRRKVFRENQAKTKQEIEEQETAKKQYLGLIKQTKSNRFNPNYKQKLVFDWDKSQDTFGPGGVLSAKLAENSKKLLTPRVDFLNNQKCKTWKEKKFQEMTDRDWRIFREDNEIVVKGGRVPYPIRNWSEGGIVDPRIVENISKLNFKTPKPIQMQTMPIGLLRKDMIGLAPTGQGKTLAYLIPALQFILPMERITAHNSNEGPYVLILVPTRQLAEQIETQFNKIAIGLEVSALTLVGGKQIQFQSLSLNKGAEILIGTPGRIKELIDKKYLSFERCSWLVIDEADKMISENLVEQVQFIMELLGSESVLERNGEHSNKRKVTHMFSATMAPEIQKLVKAKLVQPSYISIGDPGSGKKEIEQYVEMIDEGSKNYRLGKILKSLPAPVIVFVSRRSKCSPLVNLIEQNWNRKAIEYNGDKSQEQRERAIQGFRSGKYEVLVATDLAGRGLDVLGVSAVINYDAPKNINQFVHRAGRTGRAGMKGKAYTLLTGADEGIFYDVKEFLVRNGFKVPEGLANNPAAQVRPGTVGHVPRSKQVIFTN